MRYTPFQPTYLSRLNPLGSGFAGISPGGALASPAPVDSDPYAALYAMTPPQAPGGAGLLAALAQAAALDEQAQRTQHSAASLPLPRQVNPAFRTPDAIGAVLAGLFGGAEGLQGFFGQKQAKAQQDTQYQGQVYDNAQRRAQIEAQGYQQRGNNTLRAAQAQADIDQRNYGNAVDAFNADRTLRAKAIEGDLNRQGRAYVADTNNGTRLAITDANNQSREAIQARKAQLERIKGDSALWRTILGKSTPAARREFAATVLKVTDPDLLDALGSASSQEVAQMAQAALNNEKAATVAPVADSQIGRNNAAANASNAQAALNTERKKYLRPESEAKVNRANAAIRNFDSQIEARGAATDQKALGMQIKAVGEARTAIDRELGQLRQGLRAQEALRTKAAPNSDQWKQASREIVAYQNAIQARIDEKQGLNDKVREMQAQRPTATQTAAPVMVGNIGGGARVEKLPAPTAKKTRSGKTRTGSSFTYTPG